MLPSYNVEFRGLYPFYPLWLGVLFACYNELKNKTFNKVINDLQIIQAKGSSRRQFTVAHFQLSAELIIKQSSSLSLDGWLLAKFVYGV